MRSRATVLLITGLFLATLPGSTSGAAGIARVPDKALIEDPAGDANYLNSQRLVIRNGDHATPVDASAAADILKVWFTHDDETVTAHIQTEAPPTSSDPAYVFRVHVNPGGDFNCLWFQFTTAGTGNTKGPFGILWDTCDESFVFFRGVRLKTTPGPGGTAVHSLSVSRDLFPTFNPGGVLGTPYATVRNYHADGEFTAPQIDDTAEGADYRLEPRD